MTGRWGELPFVALALCLVSGICLSNYLSEYSFLGLSFGTTVLIGAALLALRRDRFGVALVLSLASIALGGLMLAVAVRDAISEADVRALLSRSAIPLDELILFDGCVTDQGRRLDGETIHTIDLHAFCKGKTWIPCQGKVRLRIPESTPEEVQVQAPSLSHGDRVRAWATWHRPRNYQNPGSVDHAGYLQRRGISLIGRIKSARLLEVIPQDCQDPWTRLAVSARNRAQNNLQALVRDGKQQQAAILASIVVGDYSELSGVTREVFQNSGTYHVLVVSGLHVGWIAWILVRTLRLLRFPPGTSRILVVLAIFFYTTVVGFQASISRSLWMFVLYITGQALFRRAAPANIALASAFLLLAARPDWLSDVGFQLSFLSVLAICLTGSPLIDQILKPLFEPVRHAGNPDRMFLHPGRLSYYGRGVRTRFELLAEACADRLHETCERYLLATCRCAAKAGLTLAAMVAISIAVQIWLEPLLAYHFNRLSWIAPLANIVVVPLSSLVLAAGMIATLAADLPLLSPALLCLSERLSTLLLHVVIRISELPGSWQRCPTPPLLCVLAGIAIVFAWSFMGWRRKWIPWLFVGLLLACLSLGLEPASNILAEDPWTGWEGSEARRSQTSLLRLTFLDVGQGDSIVIRFPDPRVWLLDAGGIHQAYSQDDDEYRFDIGETVVSRYFWRLWINELDRVIVSHPDQDHGGGIAAVLRNFRVGGLEYAGSENDPLLTRVLSTAGKRRVSTCLVKAGEKKVLNEVLVEVLNPPAGEERRSTNESSVVLRLTFGDFSALLAGDLEKSGEQEFLTRCQNIKSSLLKVAHHGSRSATGGLFLDRVQPRWAVISTGRNNPFGHPSHDVILRLLQRGVRPILTLDQGAISLATDGTRFLLESHLGGILEKGVLSEARTGPHLQESR